MGQFGSFTFIDESGGLTYSDGISDEITMNQLLEMEVSKGQSLLVVGTQSIRMIVGE